jgi:hypothetical protein
MDMDVFSGRLNGVTGAWIFFFLNLQFNIYRQQVDFVHNESISEVKYM